eukprot:scaffold7222_cov535-Prasinococcus_capsulatus_cf.AAC.10
MPWRPCSSCSHHALWHVVAVVRSILPRRNVLRCSHEHDHESRCPRTYDCQLCGCSIESRSCPVGAAEDASFYVEAASRTTLSSRGFTGWRFSF